MTNPIDGSFNKSQINQTTSKVDNKAGGQPAGNKTSINQESAGDQRPASSDQVVLTPFSQKIQQMEKNLASQPDMDSEKIDRIKQEISDGHYKINSEVIASKLIEIEKLLK